MIDFEGAETLFLKVSAKDKRHSFPERTLFNEKKVFSQTLFPKTAAASREKPLVFNWDDVWEAHGCADAGAEQA
jgi:hypothetical protein